MERCQVLVKSARLVFPGRGGQFAVRRSYHRQRAAESVRCRRLIRDGVGVRQQSRQSRQRSRGHHDAPHASTNGLTYHVLQRTVCVGDPRGAGPCPGKRARSVNQPDTLRGPERALCPARGAPKYMCQDRHYWRVLQAAGTKHSRHLRRSPVRPDPHHCHRRGFRVAAPLTHALRPSLEARSAHESALGQGLVRIMGMPL